MRTRLRLYDHTGLATISMSNQTTAKLGLGLAALGRPGYINLGHGEDLSAGHDVQQMQTSAHEVMDSALELGVVYFDAARSYGLAERFLAEWLDSRNVQPGQVTIASKWGYTYTADWNVSLPAGQAHEIKEHSLERLDKQFIESKQLIGDHLDLYQIHSATLESGVLSNSEVLDRLAELRDAGLRIGLSVSGPNQPETISRALQCKRGNQDVFSAVQATWNLLEPSAASALRKANEAGWKVIIKEGVANGRLTARNKSLIATGSSMTLQQLTESLNTTIDAVALAAALAQPWATIVLSGATTVDQLQSNARALELVNQLPAGQLEELQNELREPADRYWETRSNLTWN